MTEIKKTSMMYRVPYADTDQMGVVYYANYLVYFERVRNEMLRDIGFTYREMESQGLGLPVIEAHCEYKAPARYDDLLEIRGWFEEAARSRIRVCCEIARGERLLAIGHTIHVCYSMTGNKLVRLPDPIRSACRRAQE